MCKAGVFRTGPNQLIVLTHIATSLTSKSLEENQNIGHKSALRSKRGVYIYIYIYIDRQIDIQIDRQMHTYMYTHTHACICMYVCMYVYIYIYIYIYDLSRRFPDLRTPGPGLFEHTATSLFGEFVVEMIAKPVHPVSVIRFPFFRTQTLENLSRHL